MRDKSWPQCALPLCILLVNPTSPPGETTVPLVTWSLMFTKIMSASCDLRDIFIPSDLGWKLKKTEKETAVERVLQLNLPKTGLRIYCWTSLVDFFFVVYPVRHFWIREPILKEHVLCGRCWLFFWITYLDMGKTDILLSFGLWESLVTPATGWKPKWHPLHTSPPFWIWYHPTNPTIPIPAPNPSICGPTKSPAQLGCVFSFWQASTLALTSNMQHPVAPTVCGRAVATCWSVWTVQFWEIRSESWNCLERVRCQTIRLFDLIVVAFPKLRHSELTRHLVTWATDFGPSVTVQGIRIYKEIQIHGEVSLKRNVQRLVANKKPFDCTAFSCAESMPWFLSHATSHQQSIVILPKAPRSPNRVIKGRLDPFWYVCRGTNSDTTVIMLVFSAQKLKDVLAFQWFKISLAGFWRCKKANVPGPFVWMDLSKSAMVRIKESEHATRCLCTSRTGSLGVEGPGIIWGHSMNNRVSCSHSDYPHESWSIGGQEPWSNCKSKEGYSTGS